MEKQKILIDINELKFHKENTIPLRNLRLLKEMRGLSYSDLVREAKLGYTREYIHKILNGFVMPKPEVKKALGEFFHVNPLKVAWGIRDKNES